MKTTSMHIKATCIIVCAALLVGGCGGSGSDESSDSEVKNFLCMMIFPLCLFQKAAETGTGQDYLKAADLIGVVGTSQDTQRNGYAAGYASSGPDGDLDAVVQKLGPEGNLLWTRRFGSPDREYAEQIVANNDGTVTTTIVKYWSVDGDPGRQVQEHYQLQLSESGEIVGAWRIITPEAIQQ